MKRFYEIKYVYGENDLPTDGFYFCQTKRGDCRNYPFKATDKTNKALWLGKIEFYFKPCVR